MTTTQKATKINRFYALYAEEHLHIDMDRDGLYCEVISESDESKTYTVRVDESGVAPVATACNCQARTAACKHAIIVNRFFARIYARALEQAEAKQATQETSGHAETAPSPVVVPAPIRVDRFASSLDRQPVRMARVTPQAPQMPHVTTDVSLLGSLNGNRGFSFLR